MNRAPHLLPVLHATLGELATQGRDGIVVMRTLLAERPVGYVAPASGLEARFIRILDEAGQAPMERQVDLGGHEWIGRVDFADRVTGVVVEVDGGYHASKLDREHDRKRDRALLACGWRAVVRVSEEQVWHRPWEVVAAVREARRNQP